MSEPFALTFFPALRNAQGTRKATTWPKLCEWLSRPVVSTVKDDTAGFSVATYAGDRRALANVEQVFAVGLDLDKAVSLEDLRGKFATSSAFVHTTWSSTLDEPRCRVFLELSRPVTGPEYRRVYQAVAIMAELGGLVVDRAASDPSRFWFRASVRAEGASFVHWACTGTPINVDAALRAVPAPAPPPPPSPRPLASGGASAFDRARKYLATVPGAVSGSGGSAHTFMVAQRLVRGFSLPATDALALMQEWNQTCSPAWSERDLVRKIDQAEKLGRMADGDMLERRR